MASNVPKFASFRPKPKEPKEPKEPSRESSKSVKHGKEKFRGDREQSQEPKRLDRKAERDTNKLFFSDRRGDPDILQYGTLNRYDIPAYRRYGGIVLGLSSQLRIDWELSSDRKIFITPVGRRREERLLTSRNASRATRKAIRFVKPTESESDLDRDYISFSTVGKRKRTDEDEASNVDYRDIDRNRNGNTPTDSDTKFDPETESGDINSEITEKNSLLIRKTRDHPEDLQAWVQLIQHQEEMIKLDRSFSELSASDRRNLSDVRISIYEEALKKMKRGQDSEVTLLLGLMKEAAHSWDEAKLAKKWADVVAKYPKSLEVWLKYLDFSQTRFTSFKYENCRATFFQCLNALRFSSAFEHVDVLLHILIRLTSMIQEAGYQELAISIWQALLETTFLMPNSLDEQTREHLLSEFEEFWESEVPRLGERDAKGWKEFNTDDAIPLVAEPKPVPTPSPDTPIFQRFRMRETESARLLKYPGRTTDDSSGEDPFHLILFSDLEDYLKVVPTSNASGTLVLEAFLCFCGLPPFPRISPKQQKWWSDPFLKHRFSAAQRCNLTSGNFAQTWATFNDCPLKGQQPTINLLFEQEFSVSNERLDVDFIHRLLKLLAFDPAMDEMVGQYLLAFELQHYPLDAFKTAKKLIKARSSSLHLYNAYGLVEARRGNSAKADQVFSAALSMNNTDTPLSTPGSLQILYSWVWEALREGDKVKSYWRLVSLHGQAPVRQEHDARPEHTSLLRSQSVLGNLMERSLLGQDYSTALLCTELLALLAYLSAGEELETGLETHQRLSKWLADHNQSLSPYAELHAQAVARLLTYHAVHASSFKPALLRATLEPLISQFPSNTILLSVYAANEARFSIDDRVRDTMNQSALQRSEDPTIVGLAFAIHYEKLRGEISGSTSHSIRALYKRAAESDGKHCPGLWKSWINFELSQLDRERSRRPNKGTRRSSKKSSWETRLEDAERRVKETFYTGMRRLPWCKDFLMLAFTELQSRGIWTGDEMWKLYHVMVEKEIRLYVELEEGTA